MLTLQLTLLFEHGLTGRVVGFCTLQDAWRLSTRQPGQRLTVASGCFDQARFARPEEALALHAHLLAQSCYTGSDAARGTLVISSRSKLGLQLPSVFWIHLDLLDTTNKDFELQVMGLGFRV